MGRSLIRLFNDIVNIVRESVSDESDYKTNGIPLEAHISYLLHFECLVLVEERCTVIFKQG